VAEEILVDPKNKNSGNQPDAPLVQSIKQGLKGARKTAEHYAEKLGKAFFSKRPSRLLKFAELSQIQGKIKRKSGVYTCK